MERFIKDEESGVEYVHVTPPNRKALAECLQKAKGAERSMAQFAEACGTSPSTFSRIAQQIGNKPVDLGLLKKIAGNAANPNEVTLEMLYKANGWFPRSEIESGDETELFRELIYGISYKARSSFNLKPLQDLIQLELLRRGYTVQRMISPLDSVISLPAAEIDPADFRTNHELEFSAGLLAIHLPDEKPYLWRFVPFDPEVLMDNTDWLLKYELEGAAREYLNEKSETDSDNNETENDQDENPKMQQENIAKPDSRLMEDSHIRWVMRKFIDRFSEDFLRDAWEPKMVRHIKTSFLVKRKVFYDAIKEFLADVRLNSIMSVILVDDDEGKILKEEQLGICERKMIEHFA